MFWFLKTIRNILNTPILLYLFFKKYFMSVIAKLFFFFSKTESLILFLVSMLTEDCGSGWPLWSKKVKVKVKSFSCVWLFATLWTVAHQAPLSMGFSRQEYWSGLPFPSPEDFPDLGIEPRSPALEADALTSEPLGKPDLSKIKFVREALSLLE